MTQIHEFPCTGMAYDACQCNDDIKTGDILLIKQERVIGIAGCWPVAVTAEHGKLHTVKPGRSIAMAMAQGEGEEHAEAIYTGVEKATQLARELGYSTHRVEA